MNEISPRLKRNCIHINDIRITYYEANSHQDEVLFFIHGNGNSADLWRMQLLDPRFHHYHVVAIDLPCHGYSGDIQEYSILSLATCLIEFINRSFPGKAVTLVGISLGGNLVAEIAGNASTIVSGLVVISAAIVGTERRPEDLPTDRTTANVLFSNHASTNEIDVYFSSVLHGQNMTWEQLLMEDYHNVNPNFRKHYPKTIADGEFSNEIDCLRRRSLPTLLITGENDNIIPPDFMAGVQLPLWRDKIYLFPKSGHFVPIDEPEAFNTLLEDYLNVIHSDS